MTEQKKKNGRPTKYKYEMDGKEMTLTELCNHFGLKYSSVHRRLKRGMDINDAIIECQQDVHCWQGIKVRER